MATAARVLPIEKSFVSLRGRTVCYEDILNERLLGQASELRAKFIGAEPFPHIVLDGLFSPELLQIIWEDFGSVGPDVLKARRTEREVTFRSRPDADLPASAQVYFDAVNSGRFLKFLTELTGIPGLISDSLLQRGGLHESRDGGKFKLHVDFNKHPVTQLDNRLVLLTYLNHNWRDEFGGALELWAGPREGCIARVTPEFGRSIILKHSDVSWHGHPTPIKTPDNRPRRSLATYYYSNGLDDRATRARYNTQFMADPDETARSRTMRALKYVMPPILVDAGRLLKKAASPKRD
jgi:hypothetical protein